MTTRVTLRPVTEGDLATLYEHQRDPVASRMAVFPMRDWDEFEAHWKRILKDPTVLARAIEHDGRLAGHVAVFGEPDERLVGYWLGREHWGKGVATKALAVFLDTVAERPLYAHVAKTNVGSIRVLEKCGFVATEIEAAGDWIMRLER